MWAVHGDFLSENTVWKEKKKREKKVRVENSDKPYPSLLIKGK